MKIFPVNVSYYCFCLAASEKRVEMPRTDPTMIAVVIGLIFMSITLCVVLRLFAKSVCYSVYYSSFQSKKKLPHVIWLSPTNGRF